MKPILKFFLPVFALSLSPLAFGQATNFSISFDEGLVPEWGQVTTQYDNATYGNVTFSNAMLLNACDFDCYDYPAQGAGGEITNSPNDPITIMFARGLDALTGWYSAPDGGVLTVYGAGGGVLATITLGSTNASNAEFSWTGNQAAYVTISANDGALNETVSGLSYTVPEYGNSVMWLLMSLGAMTLGLAFRTRAAVA